MSTHSAVYVDGVASPGHTAECELARFHYQSAYQCGFIRCVCGKHRLRGGKCLQLTGHFLKFALLIDVLLVLGICVWICKLIYV